MLLSFLIDYNTLKFMVTVSNCKLVDYLVIA